MRRLVSPALALVLVVSACAGGSQRAAHCRGVPDLDLWAADLDGNVTRMIDQPGADGFADWSPDGTRIAFAASRDGNCEIYVMRADGSDQVNLTNSEADELYPSWSPDGTQIVFASTEAGGAQLFVLDVGSGERWQLTTSGLVHNYPDWSPDGTTIVFSGGTQPAGPDIVHDIYVMPATGGAAVPLTLQTELLSAPKWSSDGSRISFLDHDGPLKVWVMDADGRNQEEVALGGLAGWSPDSDRLVLDREVDDGDVDLFVVEMGSGDQRLVVDGPGVDAMPVWSPDGQTILFSSDRP